MRTEFIQNPNLPDKKISLCAVQNDAEIIKALNKLGIAALSPEKDSSLYEEVSCHADMLLCHTGYNKIILAPSQKKLYNELNKRGFEIIFSEELKEAYPADILLNVAVSKSFACANFNFSSKILLKSLQDKTLINVKQGYTKCSLCFVSENAYITEDTGIAAVLRSKGADVLLIEKGDIFLSEKHYGFFGGAAGKISGNELAVCGKLSTHRNSKVIEEFLYKHCVSPVELCNGQIRDIGGILPLTQEI